MNPTPQCPNCLWYPIPQKKCCYGLGFVSLSQREDGWNSLIKLFWLVESIIDQTHATSTL